MVMIRNKLGNLERFAENVGTETHETAYAYDRDNRVTALTYDGDAQKVLVAQICHKQKKFDII